MSGSAKYISQLRQPRDSRERQQRVRTEIATGAESRERNRETITSRDRRLENEKIKEGHREMPTNNTGMQTRAMAQCTDSKPQETQNQNVNPTVELYKSKDESIKDFVRKHGTIALDWYYQISQTPE